MVRQDAEPALGREAGGGGAAFTGLHRVEAACIPTNNASIRLLEKTGFVREGFAREYLCINGTWQDHLLYARLKDAPKQS